VRRDNVPLMTDHQEKADEAERELDDLQEQSDKLGEDISETKDDWERKKGDDAVPGASGDPDAAEADLPPEANETSRGD